MSLTMHRKVMFNELKFPPACSIVVLAPHPDDFDAIGVSLKFLHEQSHIIHLAVLTSGAGGIDDGWNGISSAAEKTAIREAEQQASCHFFGLPSENVHFFRLWEQSSNESADYEKLRSFLLSIRPDFVFLPHGNDSNRTHRRTYDTFHTIATMENLSLTAFLNLDAKTIEMRPDVYMFFDEQDAAWKKDLLRFHRSQQERNLNARGHGFDERVLKVNYEAALATKTGLPYAEVFELQEFGSPIPILPG
jgi:LmbE family N-acetylglucosaminyl deacetylase